jgi:O-antigen/teichoic acid export membrane protein
MIAFPAFCMSAVYSTLLTATGGLRLMSSIALFAALINLTANFFIIPQLGAEGAAWIAAATQWVVALAYTFAVGKQTSLQYQSRWIGRHLLFLLLIFSATWCTYTLGMDWKMAAACIAVAAFILVLGLRIISPAEIRSVLRR